MLSKASTVVLEKILESYLDCKKIKPINPKDNPSWIFIGRVPIRWFLFWFLIWFLYGFQYFDQLMQRTDPDAGKDWMLEEKGMTVDDMVGWHHQLDGHQSEQVLGVGGEQGSLARCSPWCHKESDTTDQLNWTEPIHQVLVTGDIIMYKTRTLLKFDKHISDQITSNCDTYS